MMLPTAAEALVVRMSFALFVRPYSVNIAFMQITPQQLPREPGSYLLMLRLPDFREIQVGRLGRLGFAPGWYLYAGSAFGPGGLAARLGHHFKPVQKPHWHIDYLRAEAMVMEAWIALGSPCREHEWAAALSKAPCSGKRVGGFGSSDCRCPSHLLYCKRRPVQGLVEQALGASVDWLFLGPSPTGP